MNKRITRKRMLVLLLTLTMILSCLNLGGYGRYSGVVNAQELAIATDSEMPVAEAGENEGEEFQYENTYSSENFDVKFKLDNVWDTGYNATVTITNTSDSVIENGCLTFPLKEAISNIWNGTVSKEHEDFYVIKNAGWNQDIAVGGSVSFGVTVYELFDSDTAGVFYNREFAVEINEGKSVYINNAAYSKEVTNEQLDIILDTHTEYNKYKVLSSNCAYVASKSWNRAFMSGKITAVDRPKELKELILNMNGSYIINLRKLIGVK